MKAKKNEKKKMDPWLVEFAWTCPECGKVIMHSYGALADVGTPICTATPDCDCDMELTPDAKVN